MVTRFENCVFAGNGGDGLRSEGCSDLQASGLVAANNGGHGVNIIESPEINTVHDSTAYPPNNKPPPANDSKSISFAKIAERVIVGIIFQIHFAGFSARTYQSE